MPQNPGNGKVVLKAKGLFSNTFAPQKENSEEEKKETSTLLSQKYDAYSRKLFNRRCIQNTYSLIYNLLIPFSKLIQFSVTVDTSNCYIQVIVDVLCYATSWESKREILRTFPIKDRLILAGPGEKCSTWLLPAVDKLCTLSTQNQCIIPGRNSAFTEKCEVYCTNTKKWKTPAQN